MVRVAGLLAFCLVLSPAAFAHAGGQPIAPADLWHHWSFDPLVWIPLVLSHWLYGRGILRAWRRAGFGRIVPVWRAACFFAGEVLLVVALISPLDPLGETLLTAHMAQHILLTSAAPMLLVLGMPVRAWIWALPRGWRPLGASVQVRFLTHALDAISRPGIATAIGVLVMWGWHAPVLFEAALQNEAIHTLEHISFFASALLVWRAALSPHASALAAASAVLATFMAGGMLGALLSLAPVQLYDWYAGYAIYWGLTPIEDQQLAGLVMWVPAGAIYLVAFVALAMRASGGSRLPRPRPSTGIIRASTSSRSMK